MNTTSLDTRAATSINMQSAAEAMASTRSRIQSIDLVRGLVIVLMVLDHVRDYFSNARFDLLDPTQTTGGLYVTRWITHLCAPIFIFLAGVSAQRMSAHMPTPQLSRFLLTRGLWLIVLEVTVVLWAWTFSIDYRQGVFLQVIWAIGASMLALAALVHLPIRIVGLLGGIIIVGHNLLDSIVPADFGSWAPLWKVLHVQGVLPVGFLSYPLIPWIGVMALGFAMGTVYDVSARRRQTILVATGVAAITLFFSLRLINVYGDPQPWLVHATTSSTVMSFFNVEKYPPSLLYLLITLGMGGLLLATAESWRGRVAALLDTFGRVPLFAYVVHIVIAHALAGLIAGSMGFGSVVLANGFHLFPREWGFDLPVVYCAWATVLTLLYPACRWFGEIKRRRKDGWLSYL